MRFLTLLLKFLIVILIDVLSDQQIFHVLLCVFVSNVLELSRGIHSCIAEEDRAATRVFEVCDVVHFVVDKEPEIVFTVMLEDLV